MKNKQILSMAVVISLTAIAFIAEPAEAQVIYKNAEYQWRGNQFIQGKNKAIAKSATEMTSNFKGEWVTSAPNYMPDMPTGIDHEHWELKQDISNLPHYSSSLIIENALYNMSLEESELAIEPDSTYRTGIFWGGVWTRDVSYSILHSLAQLCPEVSMRSLLAKVDQNNRIIQDTGTGGAWPCSTDRTTWVLAAWECYLVTGSKEWLDRIYPVIKNTLEDDHIVAFDPNTQLMRGETSWLDWREQEYPTWMQPADIYQSEAMATTAVHYRSLCILAEICRIEGQPVLAKKYDEWATSLKDGMNKQLWMEDKGLYAIYLYGRNHLMQHPQMEILGESFAILWDIASPERQRHISEQMVSENFGTPDFYPNLKDQYPYHNDAMWPFTQGYWLKAQAKAGNEQGVLHGISSIYRLAAMSLSNMENMVIWNGDYKGLAINSPRQLWSVAANLSIVPNVLFGIRYELDGIHFYPFIPKTMKGERRLQNFKYRQAVLDMSISGFGNHIASFKLDGVECDPVFSAAITGSHTIQIQLDNKQPEAMQMTLADNAYQPVTPVVILNGNEMAWDAVADAANYEVIKDGQVIDCITDQKYVLTEEGEYSVRAVSALGWTGYMSEPIHYYNTRVAYYEMEQYALPFNPFRKMVEQSEGTGGDVKASHQERTVGSDLRNVSLGETHGEVVQITRNENILITIPLSVSEDGNYALDWRYANGNGPINTDNKCATRKLCIDGELHGVSVFPHRGTGEWSNWGWSNPVVVSLSKGQHVVTLEFGSEVENMNIHVNQALIDQLRITKL